MDATSPELAGDAPAVPMQRRDARSRDIVDAGIAMQQSASTVSAVEFLRSRDIGARVIARVLGEPEHRRPT
ncbi:MAG: hypothetical protein WCC39_14515 [Telluria sp.]